MQDCECANFPDDSGKLSWCLLCVISEEHEVITKLLKISEMHKTAIIRNFYKAIIQKMDVKKFGLKRSSRIKTFVFKFISVPAKWIRMARQNILNIYTDNEAYAHVFKTDFG